MRLRKLQLKDASLMLEWMHDPTVVKNLQANFMSKTIEDCIEFINNSENMDENLHLAIVDDNDVYMGTVSLKNITSTEAEFAITIRTEAMGKGYSKYAMAEIIKIGKENVGLRRIFWCVSPDNKRAIRFYDKNGYTRVTIDENVKGYTKKQIDSLIWYSE